MNPEANNQSGWMSGEICKKEGIYFSDTCGHSNKKEYRADDLFTCCPVCRQSLRWQIANSNEVKPQKSMNLNNKSLFAFLHPDMKKA